MATGQPDLALAFMEQAWTWVRPLTSPWSSPIPIRIRARVRVKARVRVRVGVNVTGP